MSIKSLYYKFLFQYIKYASFLLILFSLIFIAINIYNLLYKESSDYSFCVLFSFLGISVFIWKGANFALDIIRKSDANSK